GAERKHAAPDDPSSTVPPLDNLPGILVTLTLRQAVTFPVGAWPGRPERKAMIENHGTLERRSPSAQLTAGLTTLGGGSSRSRSNSPSLALQACGLLGPCAQA